MGKLPNPESESEENDSDYGEDMLEMIEEDDLEFIKNAITSKSYNIFNKVRYTGWVNSLLSKFIFQVVLLKEPRRLNRKNVN